MGPIEAVKTVLIKKYATFSGRASRSEYWWFTLFYYSAFILGIILLRVIWVVLDIMGIVGEMRSAIRVITIIAFFLSWVALFLPSVAVTVRRLHDRNLSGWWYLCYNVAVFLFPLIPEVVWLVIMARAGDKGVNRFGDDPLGATHEIFA